MSKKAILVITDGIGYCERTEHNAFYHAKKPTYDKLFKETPHSLIDTFGLSVGLPEGQMGNSEVGHLSIGSGRILYQDLVKISLALKEDTLKDNEVLKEALNASENIHIMGLLSDGGVHSHITHLMGVAKIAEAEGKKVYLHLITDGRDVSPTSAKNYISQIEEICNENISIASIAGRFYTMDRDNRWERVAPGYKAMVEASPKSELSVQEYIDASYAKEETDEFILPSAFSSYKGMNKADTLISINFRSDRVREITTALGDKDFDGFDREFKDLHIATMTSYNKSFPYPVMFPKDAPQNTLAEVISKAGLNQLHTAETEKYAHVTFFLNGGIDEPFLNETRVLIPSPKVKTYDEKPEMSAPEVGNAVRKAMDEGTDFIVVNFANGDMVGHTGNIEASIKAVEAVDKELNLVFKSAKENDYAVVLTSDHGNCEEMKDELGNILTNHTVGKVWCFVEADGIKEVKTGGLNNIAPTILTLMGLEIPSQMDEALI
ncbi:2,3-bisphosphoglycerate-independent phosphoglycerate mutase [Sulfurimonas sp. MAG313]|nr:2,3-bisphosphoglycerate-independent phosphoglycerate mutase [Sulfurimonas sp. MAG313]MDF1880741.1 2,3-bisphosphoglycerate-independent phosphoglycerate mutase [Sulfurimonas sp. MAG313]